MPWAAADLLIKKIVSLIRNEASLIGGIEDQLNELKDELTSMKSFLEDADKKRSKTAGEQSWVANRLKNDASTIHLPKNLYKKHRFAKKLEKINHKIKVISERRQRYGIDLIEGSSSDVDDFNWDQKQTLADASLFMRHDDFIGYESDLKLIMEWLQNENSGLSIFSAVGLGGSGKTTLVAKAYNSKIVKQHFNCHAWITVSQKYDTRRLLRNMIKELYKAAAEPVPEDVNSLNYRELIEMLANYLCLKRYLLVLDDVSNIQLWTAINASLPNEGVGTWKSNYANKSKRGCGFVYFWDQKPCLLPQWTSEE
ncbi:disease resistance protein RPM1-like [Coffea arabica]|uniref:Disease resistance protein RPM1-like n=1 Tax=Coffea arabica TaxID=13443 RepID=A0ABM4VYN4_COFAR